MGISGRTGNSLSNPVSHVYDHLKSSGHAATLDNFEILDTTEPFCLKAMEAFYIYLQTPTLNKQVETETLEILK